MAAATITKGRNDSGGFGCASGLAVQSQPSTGHSFPFVLRAPVSNNCSGPNCSGNLGVSLRIYRTSAEQVETSTIRNEHRYKRVLCK